MYYFTADLHLGNEQIIKRENRPFNDIIEFQKFFINDVNSKCTKFDTLYVLGDWINYNVMTYKPNINEVFSIVKYLVPKVILIIGNNEERVIKDKFNGNLNEFRNFCKDLGFNDVLEEDYVEFGNRKFYLNHYPRKHKKEYTNLFGHMHRATGLWKPYGLNIGTDINNCRIFDEIEILHILDEKERFWDNDIDVLDL